MNAEIAYKRSMAALKDTSKELFEKRFTRAIAIIYEASSKGETNTTAINNNVGWLTSWEQETEILTKIGDELRKRGFNVDQYSSRANGLIPSNHPEKYLNVSWSHIGEKNECRKG